MNGPYSFSVAPGECLGVSGASGVGKSLLLRALVDLDRHRGVVLLDDRSCESYPAPVWRQRVALVPAEPRWWYGDVGAHLPADAEPAQLTSLLAACGFADDVLGWQVNRLSTGEKQRLAVVRALIRKPAALLLDETGSALDEENARRLEAVIAAYRNTVKSPVLWVSHDREQLGRVAGRRLVLFRERLEIEESR